jgi:hypothetical protein
MQLIYAIVEDGLAILPGQQVDVLIETDEGAPQAAANARGSERTASQ